METIEDGRLLRIFVGEDDQHDGVPLFEAIVRLLREEGLAGTTVLRGIAGFGRSSVVHTSHLLRMSEDLPIVIECVDTAERVEAVLPALDALIDEGLITLERVDVRIYRGREQ
jgi:PII-like signaling protein